MIKYGLATEMNGRKTMLAVYKTKTKAMEQGMILVKKWNSKKYGNLSVIKAEYFNQSKRISEVCSLFCA